MDKIRFEGMTFYGYHGVYPEENKLGQTFMVDVELFLNLRPAGKTDDLAMTVNYGELYQLVADVVEGESVRLLETIGEKIASNTLDKWDMVQEVLVRVIKPTPPIPGHYRSVSIELRRKRDES
jgi:dihydroneopterin aldolase